MVSILTYNEKIDAFIADAIKEMEKGKVNITLSTNSTILYGDDDHELAGYFIADGENGHDFGVAVGGPIDDWFPVFVHEFNHFRQHKKKTAKWLAQNWIEQKYGDTDPLFDWINNKIELTKRDLAKLISITRNMELECEIMTVRTIREYELPIDIEQYSRKAAAYVHFYNFIGMSRKWYASGHSPYGHPGILEHMPTNLQKAVFSKIPEDAIPLYWNCVLPASEKTVEHRE